MQLQPNIPNIPDLKTFSCHVDVPPPRAGHIGGRLGYHLLQAVLLRDIQNKQIQKHKVIGAHLGSGYMTA